MLNHLHSRSLGREEAGLAAPAGHWGVSSTGSQHVSKIREFHRFAKIQVG